MSNFNPMIVSNLREQLGYEYDNTTYIYIQQQRKEKVGPVESEYVP